MALIGQPAEDAVAAAPLPGWAGVGTVTMRELSTDPAFGSVRQLGQHMLVLVTVGHGHHEIDFRGYPCRPGTLLWGRPGQVVRFGGQAGLDAIVVCWESDTVAGLADDNPIASARLGPSYWQLAGEDEDAVINEVSQLVVDCQRHRSGALAAGLLRHQLAVLLLRIALLPARNPFEAAGANGAFTRFRHEVEEDYARTRRVEEYAERMGYSVRTITRACLAATGRSAKQVIDDRVTLEAKRLLVATDAPIADIGRQLGFPEPTNFGRFFHRETGASPGAFRAAQRATSRVAAHVPAQRPSPAEEQRPAEEHRPALEHRGHRPLDGVRPVGELRSTDALRLTDGHRPVAERSGRPAD